MTTPEPVLFSRLREHANSIRTVETYHRSKDASNLKLHDFRCRYLVADDIWVPLGEALLIGHYRPVWNVVVDGFGNHAPGGGREQQARSLWDELHPGRSWAERLPSAALTVPKIMTRVKQHLGSVGAPDLSITPPLGADVQHAQANESEEEEQSTLPFE